MSTLHKKSRLSESAPGVSAESVSGHTIILEVNAAYNRTGVPMPNPNSRKVLNLEMLMEYPFYWEWLNEQETEEVLMDLYIARTRLAQ